MAIEKILVVDDEPLLRNFLLEVLKRQNKQVTLAENGQIAIDKLKSEEFDLILTDMKMPLKNGLEVLRYAKSLNPDQLIVIITAHGSFEEAVEAMRLGAFNYLIKPTSIEALEALLEKAQEHKRLVLENAYLREKNVCRDFIADSPEMKKILKDLTKVAMSHASVLIQGESGTGKEVIANFIHHQSQRQRRPFIKVNCAAVPETLLESEFFGHERGSFTGAHQKKLGKFELADHGTLLLDEVTEIPLSLQAKLLRAIQEQEIERIGAGHPIKIDVRFIATTNRDLLQSIQEKTFREDLYYRLNVIPIRIPSLRERPKDILPLAEYFLEKFCQENHKQKKQLSLKAREKLINYTWPGNVRELANTIERTVVLESKEWIEAENLYLSETAKPKSILPQNITLHELEKKLIVQTLEQQNFHRTNTAKILGISVRTLRNKIHEYGLK